MDEVAVKKRGRPKKSEKTSSTLSGPNAEARKSVSKQNNKSRPFSTTEAVAKEGNSKTARKKRLTAVDEDSPTVIQSSKSTRSKASQTNRQQEALNYKTQSVSGIKVGENSRTAQPDKTNRFIEDRLRPLSDPEVEEPSKAAPMKVASPLLSAEDQMQVTKKQQAAIQSTVEGAKQISETPILKDSAQPSTQKTLPVQSQPPQSSFLTSFLSDTPAPSPSTLASESSRISDRSAFNNSQVPIDNITSGAGVSNLSNFPEPKPSTKRVRESAIPITAARTFKAHGLRAFPDAPPKQSITQQVSKAMSRQIDPTTYGAGSFSAFKSSQPLATPNTSASSSYSTVSKPTNTTTAAPQIPPQSSFSPPQPSQSSLHPQTAQPKPYSSHPQNQNQAPRQQHPTAPPPPSNQSSNKPAPQPQQLGPKRPTQMTPDELRRNVEFRALRRRWTSVIIGVPVLVVTSWLLWKRAEREDQGEKAMEVLTKRERGVMPRRVLDDGGLKRE